MGGRASERSDRRAGRQTGKWVWKSEPESNEEVIRVRVAVSETARARNVKNLCSRGRTGGRAGGRAGGWADVEKWESNEEAIRARARLAVSETATWSSWTNAWRKNLSARVGD